MTILIKAAAVHMSNGLKKKIRLYSRWSFPILFFFFSDNLILLVLFPLYPYIKGSQNILRRLEGLFFLHRYRYNLPPIRSCSPEALHYISQSSFLGDASESSSTRNKCNYLPGLWTFCSPLYSLHNDKLMILLSTEKWFDYIP